MMHPLKSVISNRMFVHNNLTIHRASLKGYSIYGKALFLLTLLVGVVCPTFAQLVEFPLPQASQSKQKSYSIATNRSLKNTRTNIEEIDLFFDDFSTYIGIPDTNKWEKGGGVYVNATAGLLPPSIGVATFDGINSKGRPYSYILNTKQAPTDTLTSRLINLVGRNDVYLSFFWQAKGMGESPDFGDSLILEFKAKVDTDYIWRQVWPRDSLILGQDFKQELIKVDADYLHNEFQFRFRLFSRPSGPYDAWHIDYVKLDNGRSLSDTSYEDIALTSPPGTLLKRYTAMPLNHFSTDELADSVSIGLYNLSSNPLLTNFTFTVQNSQTAPVTTYTYRPNESFEIPAKSRYTSTVPIDKSQIAINPDASQPVFLNCGFKVDAVESNKKAANDVAYRKVELADYYAYDDGSAEYGIGIRQRQGKVAYQFNTTQPGHISKVYIYFAGLERPEQARSFVLTIWKNLDDLNRSGSVLHQESFTVQYDSTALNSFIEYKLKNTVPVSDSFYVGWQQNYDELLAVGLDKNTDAGNKVFYNLGSKWERNTLVKGSPMIRPAFGPEVVGLEEEAQKMAFSVFPNPTTGLITWKSAAVSFVEVIDFLGRKVKESSYQYFDSQKLSLADLPDGLYLVQFTLLPSKQQVVKKIWLKRK